MHTACIAFFIILGVAAAADKPVVNTPTSVVQCLPSQITFSCSAAPCYISVIPGGQPGAVALETFPQGITSPYTWTATRPAGESITLEIRDNDGQLNYSQQVTVQAGTRTDCTPVAGSNNATSSSPAPAPVPVNPVTTNTSTSATKSNSSAPTTASPPVTSASTTPATPVKGASPFTTPSNNTSNTTSNPSGSSSTNSSPSSASGTTAATGASSGASAVFQNHLSLKMVCGIAITASALLFA